MRSGLQVGATATVSLEVTEALTVARLPMPGTAHLPLVFATGYLVAFAETAAMKVIEPYLDDNEDSLGVDVALNHTAATPVGMTVTATATVTAVEKRRVRFQIVLRDETDQIGEGTHERAVIDRAKFEAKLAEKAVSRGA